MSAFVLSIFPPAFAVVLYVIQPDYMKMLFENSIGIMAVVVSAVIPSSAWSGSRRIVEIEV